MRTLLVWTGPAECYRRSRMAAPGMFQTLRERWLLLCMLKGSDFMRLLTALNSIFGPCPGTFCSPPNTCRWPHNA
jgi:hypothetical protein